MKALSSNPNNFTKSKYCPISTNAEKTNTNNGITLIFLGIKNLAKEQIKIVTSISPIYGLTKSSRINKAINISIVSITKNKMP